MNRSTARFLAWAAVIAQALFVCSWIVVGALDEGYSHLEQGVSELGARTAGYPVIANAAIVLLGASFIAVGLALLAALPARPSRLAAVGLFGTSGVALALGGVFPLDCAMSDPSCESLWRTGRLSWQHEAHLLAELASLAFFVLTPFAIARTLWPSPASAAALYAGVFGVAFAVLVVVLPGWSDGVAAGLVQRVALAVGHLWVVIVATGVLWQTRGDLSPCELVPIRPRDFLARAWTGEGEVVIWPYAVGRLLAPRFTATREATWLSDGAWRFDDQVQYGDGRVERRRTYCEFVSEDHVRLTAADLPDGADVHLEEGGYRMVPWRMNWRLGPVPVLIRCRDISGSRRTEPS